MTYSTPGVTPAGELLVPSTGEFVAFDAETGKRRWWARGIPYQPKPSPVVSSDGKTVYFAVSSVEETSKAQLSSWEKLLERLDADGDGNSSLEDVRARKGPVGAFAQIDLDGDLVFTRQEWEKLMKIAEAPHTAAAIVSGGSGDQTGKMLWSLRKGVPRVSSPILVEGVFFLFKEGGILTSVRAADGTVLKEGRVGTGIGNVWASPVAVGGNLYLATEQGKIVVVKAEAQWEAVATNDLEEPCFVTPAIADGRLFIRMAGNLWCSREAK